MITVPPITVQYVVGMHYMIASSAMPKLEKDIEVQINIGIMLFE